MQVCFKVFRGDRYESRRQFYNTVAEFATLVGRERLINITHSDGNPGRMAVVWYWYDKGSGNELPGVVTFEMDPDDDIVPFEMDPQFKHDTNPPT